MNGGKWTAGEWRAYQGPNGWYVARECADGSHRQPANGGTMSRAEAERAALAKAKGEPR